jgi:hypothetical protein
VEPGEWGSERLLATSASVVVVDLIQEDDFGEVVTVEAVLLAAVDVEGLGALIEGVFGGRVSSGERGDPGGDHGFDETGRVVEVGPEVVGDDVVDSAIRRPVRAATSCSSSTVASLAACPARVLR